MKRYNVVAIALMIAGISAGIFYACQKESTLQNTLQNTSTSLTERKAKTYKIKKLAKNSYKWDVYCDGKWVAGSSENTRAWARKAVKDIVCKSIQSGGGNNYGISIISQCPDDLQGSLNALIVNGDIEYIDEVDPWTNEFRRFTRTQQGFSANVLAWLSEICDYNEALTPAHIRVASQLKVWGVYLGGNSVTEIISLHNLTAQQFNAIATKSWEEITIEQTEIVTIIEEDEKDIEITTIHLDWDFEY